MTIPKNLNEQLHTVYLKGDFSVLPYFSTGLQVGLFLFRERSEVTNLILPFERGLELDARFSFEVPLSENFSLGSLTLIRWFVSGNHPAAGFANLAFVSASF